MFLEILWMNPWRWITLFNELGDEDLVICILFRMNAMQPSPKNRIKRVHIEESLSTP